MTPREAANKPPPEPRPVRKLKVRNRSKGPRGFTVRGRSAVLLPGEEAEIELDDYTAERLQVSSDAGGDVEVVSGSGGSVPRAQMKKG